jgi:hypothetical protein
LRCARKQSAELSEQIRQYSNLSFKGTRLAIAHYAIQFGG